MQIDILIFIVFILSFSIQLAYQWLVFARFAFYKPKRNKNKTASVSVIIVARNEYHNLINTLEPILNQDYLDYEVVVVNDNSDDDTHYFLKELSKKYINLKVVQIEQNLNFFNGKKFPLSIGIKSASHDTLLLTEADCEIPNKHWISDMQEAFQDKTQIVLGFGTYKTDKGLLNMLIRFDAFLVAMNYFSFALARIPFMGVGRNLAYSKALFYQKNGFINHLNINAGDDDLFINNVANKENTEICIAPSSFTYTEGEKHFSTWMKRKSRNILTGSMYKARHRLLMRMYPLSLFAFYSAAILLIIINSWVVIVLPVLFVRTLGFLILQKSALQKLKEQKLLLFSPVLEVFIYFIRALVMAINIFNSKYTWK